MRCKECGRSGVPAGSMYCNWCGKKLVKTRAKKGIKVPEPKQLPSGAWNIYLRKEELSITEDTAELCRAKAIAVRSGFLEKTKAKSITLTKAVDAYIEAKQGTLSPATIRGYRTIQKTRFKAYMTKDITKMTDRQWQQAISEEAQLCGTKTLQNAWRFIASVIRSCGLPNPMVTLPQVRRHDTPFLEPDEITRFIKAIEGTEIEIVCLLGLSSLRASEAHALRWEDVDLKKRIMHVHRSVVRDEHGNWIEKDVNKNQTSTRNVPIMMDRLHQVLLLHQKPEGRIVEMTAPMVSKRLPKACRTAEVKQITFHGLRHSFASLAAHLGMPESVAMQIGGWSNDKIMKRIYTHVLETDVNRYQNEMAKYYNANANLQMNLQTV